MVMAKLAMLNSRMEQSEAATSRMVKHADWPWIISPQTSYVDVAIWGAIGITFLAARYLARIAPTG